MEIFSKLVNCIYPRHCLACRRLLKISSKNKWYCSKCKPVKYVSEITYTCERCGRPIEHSGLCAFCNEKTTYYDRGYVLYKYDGIIQHTMLGYKFHDKKSYSEFFAEGMIDYIKDKLDINYDYITCVPVHISRRLQRGYNQSELVAKQIAKHYKIPFRNLLKKTKSGQQSSLSAANRAINVKDVFSCDFDLTNKTIMIVDDVFTTGNTINECCKILKLAGSERVDFFTMAGVQKEPRIDHKL